MQRSAFPFLTLICDLQQPRQTQLQLQLLLPLLLLPGLLDWLPDRLTDWRTGGLADWLTGCLAASKVAICRGRGAFMAQLTYKTDTGRKDKFAALRALLFAIGLALGFEFYWLFGYWLIYCTCTCMCTCMCGTLLTLMKTNLVNSDKFWAVNSISQSVRIDCINDDAQEDGRIDADVAGSSR